MNDEPLALSIVGPGGIAEVMAAAATECGAAKIHKVVGRRPERTAAFVQRFGGRDAEDFVRGIVVNADDPTEALYVATPHRDHFIQCLPCFRQRIPVLCEKPLTTSSHGTDLLVEKARQQRTLLVEGWMYRHHPQMARLFELVADGAIGSVRRVASEFAYEAPFDPAHRLFDMKLGGGAILDVGGYPLSFAFGVARAARGGSDEVLSSARVIASDGELTPMTIDGRVRTPDELRAADPEVVTTALREGRASMPVDGDARATIEVGGITADLSVAIVRAGGMSAAVEGERGRITVEQPFLPEGERRGRLGVLHLERDGRTERIEVPSEHDCFELEALSFRDLVRSGALEPAWPLVDHAETRALGRLMDEWKLHLLATLSGRSGG